MKLKEISFIDRELSLSIDKELMSTFGYSIDQLMELAGLTVANVIQGEFIKQKAPLKILTLCGPGNNGGDGLVASRHLKEFGNSVDILYPKRNTKNDLYKRLVTQCENYEIKFLDKIFENKDEYEKLFKEYDFIVDALFGFSFKGDIRPPFKVIIDAMKKYENKIISVDVPSGFDILKGNVLDSFVPKGLVSLTLPKLCSKDFKGEHFLGGRFVPKKLFEKFNLETGEIYKGNELYTKV